MRQFLSATRAKTPEAVLADAPFHAFSFLPGVIAMATTQILNYLEQIKKTVSAAERTYNREGQRVESRFAPSSATPAAFVFPNVEATMDANAATTNSSVNHANVRNSRFAFCPIVSRMTSPMDWPRLRMDANSAPKSCTPPKKMPPTTTQRSTGTQPKIAACRSHPIPLLPVLA